MFWWYHLSALGGLNITLVVALGVTAWLAAARCWRLALAWCIVFGGVMVIAALSQMAFIGWGIGVEAVSFTGFSGHAARAAAVFPVALFLAAERRGPRVRMVAVALGALLAVGVAVARVKVGAHMPSEAVTGCALGLGAAALFVRRARGARDSSPQRLLLVGMLAAVVLMPRAEPFNSHQWLTAAALKLSGRDRVYLRNHWQPARNPYVPPCSPARVRFDYLCT